MIVLGILIGIFLGGLAVAYCVMESRYEPQVQERGLSPQFDPFRPGQIGVEVNSRLYENLQIPPGLGLAWVAYDRDTVVLLPVPFNLLARYARRLYGWMRFRHETLEKEAYAHAYRMVSDRSFRRRAEETYDAYRRGYTKGQDDTLAHVERMIDSRAKSPLN